MQLLVTSSSVSLIQKAISIGIERIAIPNSTTVQRIHLPMDIPRGDDAILSPLPGRMRFNGALLPTAASAWADLPWAKGFGLLPGPKKWRFKSTDFPFVRHCIV